MLQETFERMTFCPLERIFVSTNEKHAHWVREQLPMLKEENLILEPSRQDTAPSMGLAAALIAKRDPNAVLAMVSSDHLVQEPKELQDKIIATAMLAEEERTLNIIEVRVKYPNTSLGYVEIGEKLGEKNGIEIYSLRAFKEKPDLATAKRFAKSWRYLWNTGYYIWRASTLLEAFEENLPQTHQRLKAIQTGGDLKENYALCDKISIDYGIMEKVDPKKVRIIPADLGWSDVGTWESLHEELSQNPEDNVLKGPCFDLESEGSILYNETQTPLVTFGLKDLVVVKTENQTFICPKNRSRDLKRLLENYEQKGN